MFVTELALKIEGWRDDATPFIHVPLAKRVVSRVEAFGFVHHLAEIVGEKVATGKPSIGLCFESPANWVLSVIATQIAGAAAVPIPKEFTQQQISSFVPNLDLVLTDSEALATRLATIMGAGGAIEKKDWNGITLFVIDASSQTNGHLGLPADAVGVIHTSGSTDFPKGVVIGDDGLRAVVHSISDRLKNIGQIHYASILPMSLLLEQILGIFVPLFTDGSVAVLPPSIPCYTGTQADLEPYIATIKGSHANFSMVPPSFLAELSKRSLTSSSSPRDLIGSKIQVLATGGATIEPKTLLDLKEGGLEVFQGYGLSENTSVVAWTYPERNSIGSVGKPLAHNKVRIADDGQVEVQGKSVFLGYVSRGEFKPRESAWLKTGDNGFFDDEGCLHITGRESNLIVLSSGRNVSPEWVEAKFKSIPSVKEILLVGHGRPFLSALVLVNKGFECKEALTSVSRHADEIKSEFPEFSRVQVFRALPFNDQYYSVSGRVLRKQVMEMHKTVVDQIYSSKKV
jgi:long-chain acyl-CoA synthetase